MWSRGGNGGKKPKKSQEETVSGQEFWVECLYDGHLVSYYFFSFSSEGTKAHLLSTWLLQEAFNFVQNNPPPSPNLNAHPRKSAFTHTVSGACANSPVIMCTPSRVYWCLGKGLFACPDVIKIYSLKAIKINDGLVFSSHLFSMSNFFLYKKMLQLHFYIQAFYFVGNSLKG